MPSTNPYIFREYDIRGLVDTDLTNQTVEYIGRAFAVYCIDKGVRKISIGGDVRLSTNRFIDILCNAVADAGINVVNIGVVPTPVSYFSLFHLDVGGMIMVTASHNPAEFNGFKLGVGKTTIYGKEIQEIYKIIESGHFITGKKGSIERHDLIPDYCSFLRSKFSFKKRLKIVIDAGNGTGALFAARLFREFGHEVHELYCTVDGRFPNHHPDPTVEKNVQDLIARVQEVNADFGVGLDGDSDRIGVIDDEGKMIYGDYLLLIYALDLLRERPGAKVIFEVKCSQALTEEIERFGGVPIMWKTGHSLLKDKMHETGALIAGEMSGHMFFSDRYFGYDDAIYAALRLMEIIDKRNEKLSAIRKALPVYFSTPEIRVECANDAEKFVIAKKAVEYFSTHYTTITTDGVRILFGDGWGLIRSSNTQPILVLRFEAKSQQRLAEIKALVTEKLKDFGTVRI
ncbi:MAG: phosphomannomutase [Candidatus Raymondbacteria bacterium RifOxyA12_full_50_37]|uniref:Phosphomannomutase n=1 Tax=Candidatus Raymondbacteria bacterium RIFOXYD12_FULL_49_13 TaxID=1817890 RepID=A0A1F7F1B8_UNCRA|nr:MAG: phosphomannomutase [Candidatus Raymondbacteria bacterium RifOxyA12_full_50_37]OGJ93138.1 MAG: phosphomannomutase [Candidatus Raymondbacteria bacterium RifOxyB12_full_50_8]OGJ93910.1 MAG: phosphomannomutase [Candidatus Raymondbacteria bacterium RIFOXYA2_FULL_49_16]OGJ98221.1 MAG: phosphomannomutase [Candidatus Raymondbacteria bacterium RIFOXYC2_FULL_50_21]OGK00454.1 MAG: phosphomannomutase [Candidatus Raymondbacteria bacterium RIFOXYD12_FULL_49_13]OGK05175.1 MAG: phosphomannomutase [Can